MKKRSKHEPMKPHEKGLLIAAIVMVALIFALPSLIFAEDFAITNNRLNATWNEVWLIYDISGVVQDTAYKYNVDRWDTTFSGIAAGWHRATFYLLDSADLTDTLGYTITYAYQSGLTLSASDITDISDAVVAAGITGSGTDTVVLYAVDTSASPDTLVARVEYTIRNGSGSKIIPKVGTGSDGYEAVHLDPGSYYVAATAPGYTFPTYALTVSGNNDSVAVPGYGSFLDNKTLLWGSLGTGYRYARVTVTMPEFVNNACDSTLLSERTWSKRTDANGGFALYVPYSSCWTKNGDTLRYVVSIERTGTATIEHHDLLVPDTASYRVFW